MVPETAAEILVAWPTALPTPLEDHQRRTDLLTVRQVNAWLIEAWPEAWYFADPSETFGTASRLLMLRDAVDAGAVER